VSFGGMRALHLLAGVRGRGIIMRMGTLAMALLFFFLPVVCFGGEERVEKWEGIECIVTRDAKHPDRPIVGLDFIGCDLKDADLQKLASVKTTLKDLNLRYNMKVTDAGMKELAQLTNLEALFLAHPTKACLVSWIPRIFSL
jgi:hypothetical protein